MRNVLRKPEWLKSQKLGARKAREIIKNLRVYNLHTVCENAKCPNQGECFERGTATFMILGETCTRNCNFCAVDKTEGKLVQPDKTEPARIAELAKELKLNHVVITTVTRDDLPDGGASQFIEVINQIKKICGKDVSVEILTSDFNGDLEQVDNVLSAAPDVFNHNIETIPRLYPEVRRMADFQRSLNVLDRANKSSVPVLTKSGFMVGLGESKEEVLSLMQKLREVEVDIVTIGQYMQPSKEHYPVKEYVHPDVFKYYQEEGEKMGFQIVESAPLVRSSYHAEKARKLITKS
ncbi:MAG: lipoyl synthase [Candidatus Cloacimonas sp. 4484_143]|nr:MAG: lipoyl synthase [Candidatus Cloacimonas sp. 4484_143]